MANDNDNICVTEFVDFDGGLAAKKPDDRVFLEHHLICKKVTKKQAARANKSKPCTKQVQQQASIH